MWIDPVASPDNYRQDELALTNADGNPTEIQARREAPGPTIPGWLPVPCYYDTRLTFGREDDYRLRALTPDNLRALGRFLIAYADTVDTDATLYTDDPPTP